MAFKSAREERIYRRYMRIHVRCNNRNATDFKYYGGRGIRLRISWPEFRKWYEKNIPEHSGLTVGRRDHAKDYTLKNIIAQSMSDQISEKNSRYTSPVLVMSTVTGRVLFRFGSITECAKHFGIGVSTISKHIKNNRKRSYEFPLVCFRSAT